MVLSLRHILKSKTFGRRRLLPTSGAMAAGSMLGAAERAARDALNTSASRAAVRSCLPCTDC
jgi:hypothetical protein